MLGVAITGSFSSCRKKEGCTNPTAINYDSEAKKDDGSCEYFTATYVISQVTLGSTTYKQIEGTINEDLTLTTSSNWMLSGGVFVDEGATLTINAGVTIYAADDGTVPFLSVLQGGKIDAVGTAASPIVFTPVKSSPAPGDWGGIILNGYAEINVGNTAEGEGGTGTYGGTDNADNSGTLKYVRVEYAGKILGTDNELNGFSFNGVGSGTTIEYIQAYKGADDGIEFFGGSVNVRYAISSGNEDDSFDWTHGWSGNGQFWVAVQHTNAGDRGIEADNNGDDNTLAPYSNPVLSNITLVGATDSDGLNEGIRLRAGTKGKIYNAFVTGFPAHGIRVSDNTTNLNMADGSLVVQNSTSWGNGNQWKDCATYENHATNSATDPATLSGFVGTSSTNATDAATLGSWFLSTNYQGAVPSSNNWTQGWIKSL